MRRHKQSVGSNLWSLVQLVELKVPAYDCISVVGQEGLEDGLLRVAHLVDYIRSELNDATA